MFSPMKPDRSVALSDRELTAWMDFWAVHLILPTRLDTRLKRESGLSHVEFAVLAKLSVTDGYNKRMSELAVDTGSTLSHLSRVVNRLEARGFVSRVPDVADGRATLVELTDAGHARVGQTAPGYAEELRRLVFDTFDDDEREQFCHLMGLLSARLQGD